MIPLPVSVVPYSGFLEPVSLLEVSLTPKAKTLGQTILAGSSVVGGGVNILDANALLLYNPLLVKRGTTTANRGRKGMRRTARGSEDGTQRQG